MFDSFFTTLVPILAILMPILVISLIVYSSVKQKRYNDSQPRLDVQAKIIGKRTKVTGHDHARTHYYITFQLNTNDRIELELNGEEYGMLVEGDMGELTFQGNRYLGFKRLNI